MNCLKDAVFGDGYLSKKEDFSGLEICYKESPEEFCREINGVLVSLFIGGYNVDALRRAVNTIEICVYFEIENKNLIPVFKNALDVIHILTYKTNFDIVISDSSSAFENAGKSEFSFL